ncbi:MAG: hypothetical protein Tsb002_24240 [Wenzhouxiangellaceae bacterium]
MTWHPARRLFSGLLCALALTVSPCGLAATFEINNTADDLDALDAMPGDGVCADNFGVCTLRAAIMESNALSGRDFINFTVAGTFTLNAMAGRLPVITDAVRINGVFAPGYDPNSPLPIPPPVVTIDGSNLSGSADGFSVSGAGAEGTDIIAVSIVNFPDNGIEFTNEADFGYVASSYIGTLPDGTAAGNGSNGVLLLNVTGVVVGELYFTNTQSFVGDANLIANNGFHGITATSGNSHKIYGNLIGLSRDGIGAAGNGQFGVNINGCCHDVGGADADENGGNVIGGNALGGINLNTSSSRVRGNRIGLGLNGLALGNQGPGLFIIGSNNEVGGDGANFINEIAGNGGNGIIVGQSGASSSDNNQIINNRIGRHSGAIQNLGEGIWIINADGTTVRDNEIVHNSSDGILLSGSNSVITGNRIGVARVGNQLIAAGNRGDGIIADQVSNNNVIGGNNASDANIIGDAGAGLNNRFGIQLLGNQNSLRGNWIGLNPQLDNLANSSGNIQVEGSGHQITNNTIGFGAVGISLDGSQHVISNNRIGSNPSGNDFGNDSPLVVRGDSHQINNNLIARNLFGIDIINTSNHGFNGNQIIDNGSFGIAITDSDDISLIGNRISDHSRGVVIDGVATGNRLSQNQIYNHNIIAVDLGFDGSTANDPNDDDTGPNNLLNSPNIVSASINNGATRTVQISYNVPTSAANATTPLTVEFFWTDRLETAQARYYLGSSTYLSPPGSVATAFTFPDNATGGILTAIATDSDGNSSEISVPRNFGVIDYVFADSFEPF